VKPQFAIRPTIRNNKDFKRDDVIKTVAAAVGPGHKVDLHGYDSLIFVEIYQVRKVPASFMHMITVCLVRHESWLTDSRMSLV
jgi:hypothetical protein